MRHNGKSLCRQWAVGLLLAGGTIAAGPAFGGSPNKPNFLITIPAADDSYATLQWERVDVLPLPDSKGWRCEAKKIWSGKLLTLEEWAGTVRCVKAEAVVSLTVTCDNGIREAAVKSVELGDSTGVYEISLICGFGIWTKEGYKGNPGWFPPVGQAMP